MLGALFPSLFGSARPVDPADPRTVRDRYKRDLAALHPTPRRVWDWLSRRPEFLATAAPGASPLAILGRDLAAACGLDVQQARRGVLRLASLGWVVHHNGYGSKSGTILAAAPWAPAVLAALEDVPLFRAQVESEEHREASAAALPVAPITTSATTPTPLQKHPVEPAASHGEAITAALPREAANDSLPPAATPSVQRVSASVPLDEAAAEAELLALAAVKAKPASPARASASADAPACVYPQHPSSSQIQSHPQTYRDASLAIVGTMTSEILSKEVPTLEAADRIRARAEAWEATLGDPGTYRWIFRWLALEADAVPAPGMLRSKRLHERQVDELLAASHRMAAGPQARASVGAIFCGMLKKTLASAGRQWPRVDAVRRSLWDLARLAWDATWGKPKALAAGAA